VIYLDHHAAAPVLPEVQEAIVQATAAAWANPASIHAAGREARRWVERARRQVADAIGAAPADLVFTPGGTAACNLGIRGLARGVRKVLTTSVEHPAVSETVARLGGPEREIGILPVRRGRPPSREEVETALGEGVLLAVQWVNHETGTIFPVQDYARACRQSGARLFVDANQALGKVPIDVAALDADAVAVGAKKIGGPAGAGALWVRRGVELDPVLGGGRQERGRWPGTPDATCMVGFGAATAQIDRRLQRQPEIGWLRDRLESHLVGLGAAINAVAPRTATACNVSFEGWRGAVLVAALDVEGVCVSAGAACSSGLAEPSTAVAAMYPDEQWRAGSAVRISLGIETTGDEIDRAAQAFGRVLARAQGQNLTPVGAHPE